MTEHKILPGRIYLFLLMSLSVSVVLATMAYPIDKKVTIILNSYRSLSWDLFWLYITYSATVFTYVLIIISIIQLFFQKPRQERLKYSVVIGVLAASSAIGAVLKHLVQRIRPYHIFSDIKPLGPDEGWSYPSGHTNAAFVLAGVLCLFFPQKKFAVILIYFWASLVGISRLYLGVHYLSDLLCAIAISSAVALSGYLLLKKQDSR